MKEYENNATPGGVIFNENCLRDYYEGFLKERQMMGMNPEGTAIHDDGEKEPIHLIPPEAMMALAKVYRYGAKKYTDPRNWEKGMNWSRLYSSAMRHMLKFWNGEDDDPESGLPHTWHAFWNVCALVWYREHHANLDDRPARPKPARGGDKYSERPDAS